MIRIRNSNSDSSDDIQVEIPVRRFTPLPDIPRSDDAYYRTESKLIQDKSTDDEEEDNSEMNTAENQTSTVNYLVPNCFGDENQLNKFNNFRKETRYHFGSNNYTKVYCANRLPALEKQMNHSLQNTMDLDEDLPMSNEPNPQNQRLVYTSPGDRMISPIKRPQAPSPAASEYRRKANKNSDSDSDDDVVLS